METQSSSIIYKQLTDKIENLYNDYFSTLNEITQIFEDFYGKDKVELVLPISSTKVYDYFKNLTLKEYTDASILQLCDIDWVTYSHLQFASLPIYIQEKVINTLDSTFLIDYFNSFSMNIYILVYFPLIQVTNENNNFIEIQDLYVKVSLSKTGNIKESFEIIRSTYTIEQLRYGYTHSHAPNFNIEQYKNFVHTCLGSGPIVNTISSLRTTTGNHLLDMWRLFCLELQKYLNTESIAGVPYKYLERILGGETLNNLQYFFVKNLKSYIFNFPYNLKDFVSYLLEKKQLNFNFEGTHYFLGMSSVKYLTIVSNAFIEYINSKKEEYSSSTLHEMKERGILIPCIIENTTIKKVETRRPINYENYEDLKVLEFKDKDIKFKVLKKDNSANQNISYVLAPAIAHYILTNILKFINYNYGKNNTDTINKKVKYLF